MFNKKYTEYCTGCGLCKSEFHCNKYNEKGFTNYDIQNINNDFFETICPISGNSIENYIKDVWGDYKEIYYGWSKNDDIRYRASSGGIITSIALLLIEKKYVDGIIQIKADEKNPITTNVVCSTTKEDILKCMGSRYSNSSVLENLSEIIDQNKKYALIGRPCDIAILKNYQKKYNKYNNIIYTISFFCAGNPSDKANEKLINELGISKENSCKKLIYRGFGWPGYVRAIDKNNKEYTKKYAESWGNFLGRDIRLMCKFCIDGCGSYADISCGDYWLLNSENKPIFEESEGRNLIFVRSDLGNNLMLDAIKYNYVFIKKFDIKKENIKDIQPAQFERTTTVFDKILAFKIFFRDVPKYNILKLYKLSRHNILKQRIKIFCGTIKRIVKKKM